MNNNQPSEPTERCPHCGKRLSPDPRNVFTFRKWATPVIVGLISLMLFLLDFVSEGAYNGGSISDRITWANWAIFGLWVFYISVQLLRSNPQYGWLMVPLSGILFSIFLILLDYGGKNDSGFLGLNWALYAIIPINVFLVLTPLVARMARVQPSYVDQLEYLVDRLVQEENSSGQN